MERHTGRYTAVPIGFFGKINTNYDEDEALPKPRRRWWDQARCRNVPLRYRDEIFFPKPGGNDPYKTARMYCQGCPVAKDCLDDAVREEGGSGRRQMIGMRGGKTPSQRWEIYKQHKAKGLIQRKSNREGVQRLGRFEHAAQRNKNKQSERE